MLKPTTMFIAFVGATALFTRSAGAAPSSDLCVGGKPGCFATIQAAVDAAQDGDTIRIGAGTFAGGITIDKDVQLIGVSAGATTIEGGGPVITIGEFLSAVQLTVSIGRVTIAGGVNNSQPDEQVTFGGGVWIPNEGATVTITDSVITRNRVTPQSTVPPGPFCGPFACAFALGGGIDNAGTLTVTNTRISDNEVGSTASFPSVASGVFGGGIANRQHATLTVRRSLVTGNRVAATAPNGQLAVGGGISGGGALTIDDSVVSDNSVDVDAAFPGEVNSFTGGIEVTGEGSSAAITRTMVGGNSVRATNAGGDVLAGVGGISTDEGVTLVLRDSAVDHNSVSVDVSVAGGNAIAFAGGLEIEGDVEVSGSHFIGNAVRASTPAGTTVAAGGGIQAGSVEPVSLSDSIVAENSVGAETTSGFVIAQGGGVFNSGLLTLRRTQVVNNSATATGPAGFAQGGGIWNGVVPLPGFPPDAQLALIDSVVTANELLASSGLERLGGGLFTTVPVTLTGTVLAGNSPDQCFGC
jgi:hypothetical protein